MPRQQKGKRGQSPPAATTNFANQKAASQAATNSLNSLRRVDPSIVEILASATHATLYNFGADQEWERADVEGPLFIAARCFWLSAIAEMQPGVCGGAKLVLVAEPCGAALAYECFAPSAARCLLALPRRLSNATLAGSRTKTRDSREY